MTIKEFTAKTTEIVRKDIDTHKLAFELEELWLKGDIKSTSLITEELKQQLKVAGIDVAVLKAIGKAAGKSAKKQIDKYSQLSSTLWHEFGLEGRIVAAHILSALNLHDPDGILTLSRRLLASCVTWAECDNMAYALEPIVRKDPENYLDKLDIFLDDDNKWIKRGALNVLARLPMKQPAYTARSLEKVISCLNFADPDVRRTCSFAIRMAARGDIPAVINFIKSQLNTDANRVWIFSDVIRSMTKSFLPDFKILQTFYQDILSQTEDKRSMKSIEAALKLLK